MPENSGERTKEENQQPRKRIRNRLGDPAFNSSENYHKITILEFDTVSAYMVFPLQVCKEAAGAMVAQEMAMVTTLHDK